jgi:cytosine/adenosine deaminase-related metal-dependent hydrolase
MMRTLIQGGWVVGYADGQHQIVRDGVCVVEEDRVLYVGKEFTGPTDATIDARGKLVSPGLISTHLHAGHNASDYVFLDVGRPEAMSRNYMNWQAHVRGKPRLREDVRLAVLFGLGQRLRTGATTVVEVGAAGAPDRFVELVDELGIRAYTGLSYRNVILYSDDDGRLLYDWDDERGDKGLRAGLAFAEGA